MTVRWELAVYAMMLDGYISPGIGKMCSRLVINTNLHLALMA